MFQSILTPDNSANPVVYSEREPACFKDLNLDQIVEGVQQCLPAISLRAFFQTPLHDHEQITYRQAVMADVALAAVGEALRRFADNLYDTVKRTGKIRQSRDRDINQHHGYLLCSQFLEEAIRYDEAVATLAQSLSAQPLRSAGLQSFVCWLANYRASEPYLRFKQDIEALMSGLHEVHYCLHIHGDTLTVHPYKGEQDYHEPITRLFDRFRQLQSDKSYQQAINQRKASHIEAAIYNLLSQWYPDTFAGLQRFYEQYADFADATLRRFAHEVQFYLCWLTYLAPLLEAQLPFCYPAVDERRTHLFCEEGFDLALAHKLHQEEKTPVPNGFELTAPERILVVTGPNQGGKTTFSRAFGQICYLASLGCLVPGRRAQLFLFDSLFTHFNRAEELTGVSGKLQDDLIRLHEILKRASQQSIVIINEIYSSTTLSDAVLLGEEMMHQLIEMGGIGVCVTFIDELTTLAPYTVSMVSTIHPDDPSIRTFRVIRAHPDGKAYAIHLAEKYGLTYDALDRRLSSCKPG